jgi:hypothetical protein
MLPTYCTFVAAGLYSRLIAHESPQLPTIVTCNCRACKATLSDAVIVTIPLHNTQKQTNLSMDGHGWDVGGGLVDFILMIVCCFLL